MYVGIYCICSILSLHVYWCATSLESKVVHVARFVTCVFPRYDYEPSPKSGM